jgi:hypothetical protein
VEEAIINAMIAAETMEGINGNTSYRLPHDATIEVLKKFNRFQPNIILENEMMEKYVGKYELNPNFYITVFREKNKIFAQATNQKKVEMAPINKHTFDVFEIGGRIVFNLDDNKNVIDLLLIRNGEYKAKKVK